MQSNQTEKNQWEKMMEIHGFRHGLIKDSVSRVQKKIIDKSDKSVEAETGFEEGEKV
ncbi:hypothetical protein ADUPG1_004129, partial [Aduncisulcus paluster]